MMAEYPNPKSLKYKDDANIVRCTGCGQLLQRARACRVCETLMNRG
jgi:hypothetical protein